MEYPDDYGITGLKIEYLDDDDDIANLNMEYPDEDDITYLNMGFQDQSYDPRPGEGFMLFIFVWVPTLISMGVCLQPETARVKRYADMKVFVSIRCSVYSVAIFKINAYTRQSVRPFIRASIYPSIYPSFAHSSSHLSARPSIHPSIIPSIYPSIKKNHRHIYKHTLTHKHIHT